MRLYNAISSALFVFRRELRNKDTNFRTLTIGYGVHPGDPDALTKQPVKSVVITYVNGDQEVFNTPLDTVLFTKGEG